MYVCSKTLVLQATSYQLKTLKRTVQSLVPHFYINACRIGLGVSRVTPIPTVAAMIQHLAITLYQLLDLCACLWNIQAILLANVISYVKLYDLLSHNQQRFQIVSHSCETELPALVCDIHSNANMNKQADSTIQDVYLNEVSKFLDFSRFSLTFFMKFPDQPIYFSTHNSTQQHITCLKSNF